jgi:MoxR-like ATPase
MATSGSIADTKQVVDIATVSESRKLVNQIYIDPAVREYIIELVHNTRNPANVDPSLVPLIRVGASPRATINLALAAKARAFTQGRAFVTPQDVKDLAPDVLRHRILPSYEAEAEEISTDTIVERILQKTIVP